MKRPKKSDFLPLDDEEKELIESIESDEWQSVSNLDEEINEAVSAARNTLRKNRRVNLRLTEKDYYQIQVKAIEEGIPYQTLISSIIHKYLSGTLVPKT